MSIACKCFFILQITIISISAQTTRHVPSQVPSIQSAISLSQPGDIVVVAPGIYNQSINFLGRAITVTSSGGPNVTTINGNGAQRVVTFATNEGPGSILSGFTIRGGRGGILCQNSSPTIFGCTITANSTNDGGGGIKITSTAAATTTAPTISNCRIDGNNSSFNSIPGFSSGGGGGIYCGASAGNLSPLIFDCQITNNLAFGSGTLGGGFFAEAVSGGGMSVDFTNCQFIHNASDFGGAVGTIGNFPLMLRSCVFEDNAGLATMNGTGIAGAMWLANTQTSIVNCVIARNTAMNGASAIQVNAFSGMLSTVNMQNSTLVSNSGTIAAIFIQATPTMSITSSILWNNSFTDVFWVNAAPTITSSIVQSPQFLSNPSNLATNPGFVDLLGGDYHLGRNSPCVGTGSLGSIPIPSTDLDGSPRIIGVIDRGADEVPAALLPGTNEDFDLFVKVDNGGDPLASQLPCPAGSVLSARLHSPLGGIVGAQQLFAGQFFSGGIPPLGILAVPAIHIDAVGSFIIFGLAGSGAFGSPGLPQDGTDFEFLVPPGLGGIALRLQAFALTALATNGLFAVSRALDVVF